MDLGTQTVEFIKANGVAVFILFAIGWFTSRQVWPFVTKVWWPVVSKRADMQLTVLSELTSVVNSLKLLVEQVTQTQARELGSLNENADKLTELKMVMLQMAATQKSMADATLENNIRSREDRQRLADMITRSDENDRHNARIILETVAALHVRLTEEKKDLATPAQVAHTMAAITPLGK